MGDEVRVEVREMAISRYFEGVTVCQTLEDRVWREFTAAKLVNPHAQPEGMSDSEYLDNPEYIGIFSFKSDRDLLEFDLDGRGAGEVTFSITVSEEMWDDYLRMMHEQYLRRHPELA